ncbi:hypothetical protein [Jiella sp. M17.18]|uniref:hypothetical protein n=1 Tax=Jiella sp. M17.18 TaxID=3234247 RepID=UPI0034DEE4A3
MTARPAECPICEETAQSILEEEFDGMAIGCPVCGTFRVSQASVDSLGRYKIEIRRGLLLSAARRVGPAQIPSLSHID